MTAFTQHHFDRYRAESAELVYLHTDDCEHYGAALYEAYHPPSPECRPVAIVSLPHQHDNWSVGTLEDVERLITDLQNLLEKMKATSTPERTFVRGFGDL